MLNRDVWCLFSSPPSGDSAPRQGQLDFRSSRGQGTHTLEHAGGRCLCLRACCNRAAVCCRPSKKMFRKVRRAFWFCSLSIPLSLPRSVESQPSSVPPQGNNATHACAQAQEIPSRMAMAGDGDLDIDFLLLELEDAEAKDAQVSLVVMTAKSCSAISTDSP